MNKRIHSLAIVIFRIRHSRYIGYAVFTSHGSGREAVLCNQLFALLFCTYVIVIALLVGQLSQKQL